MIPERFKSFFVRPHYSFSTQSPGRLTTFYFKDEMGNTGRIRRQPGGKPLVAYQGPAKRIFISPDGVGDFIKFISQNVTFDVVNVQTAMAHEDKILDADKDGFYLWAGPDDLKPSEGDNFERISGMIDQLSGGGGSLLNGKVSVTPIAGWHLYDFLPATGFCHSSSGKIVFFDTDFTPEKLGEILSEDTIAWNDWVTGESFPTQ